MGGLTHNLEITLDNWINSLNTTSSLDIRVAPATRTRGEGGLWPPSPLVIIMQHLARIIIKLKNISLGTYIIVSCTNLKHM